MEFPGSFVLILWCFSGKIFPSGVAADSYKKAVESAIQMIRQQEASHHGGGGIGGADLSKLTESLSYVHASSLFHHHSVQFPFPPLKLRLILFWFIFCFFSDPKTPIELAIDFILHDFEMAG